MSESEGLWGLFYQNVEGSADVSNLVFKSRASAEAHAKTLRDSAGIVSVELRRYSVIQG